MELAKCPVTRGRYFSIENPFASLIRALKAYARLATEDGVRTVRLIPFPYTLLTLPTKRTLY